MKKGRIYYRLLIVRGKDEIVVQDNKWGVNTLNDAYAITTGNFFLTKQQAKTAVKRIEELVNIYDNEAQKK